MTWETYTRAHRLDRPVLAIDTSGYVRVWTTALQHLVGIDAKTVIGKLWEQVGTRAERKWLLSGQGVRIGEIGLAHRSGPIRVAVIAWPVSSKRHAVEGVMCWVENVAHGDAAHHQTHHRCYEIATPEDGDGFGHIVRDYGTDQKDVGERCYEVIAGESRPCTRCPVPALAIGARATAVVKGRDNSLVVVRASRPTSRTATVCRDRIDAETLTSLAHARLDIIASERSLSEREREVLHRLAWGASVDEIALTLDITPRTVKFHAANVLTKLGLDSRLELVRLALDAGTGSPLVAPRPSVGSASRARVTDRAIRRSARVRQVSRRRRP